MSTAPEADAFRLVGSPSRVQLGYPDENEAALRHGWDRVRRGATLRRIVIDHTRVEAHDDG